MSYAWPPPPEASFSFTSWSTLSIVALAIAVAVHKILGHLDYPLLSLPELAWNRFVRFMPAKLVYTLHSGSTRFLKHGGYASDEHATKSEVMRDVLGLNKGDTAFDTSALGPRGLGNWDNSCYQNSVLQALSSLSDLRHFLDNLPDPRDEKTVSTLGALHSLTEDLNKGGGHLWTPAKLKSMNSWLQQDAQEYFSKIMDSLETDVKELLKEKAVVKDPGLVGLRVDEDELKGMQDSGVFPESDEIFSNGSPRPKIPSNPLEGLVAQRVGCLRCGYSEGLSLIPFNCLTVPLGKQSIVDIRDCLDSFSDLELIEGVECGKCTLLSAEKSLKQIIALSQPPDSSESVSNTKQQAFSIRLQAIKDALDSSSFSDTTLSQTCQIPPKLRITSTKSRQAVMMRPPKCLVLHVNRSLFDEYTGMQSKNQAHVIFPATFDLGPWCVGGGHAKEEDGEVKLETWEMDPAKSMRVEPADSSPRMRYQLRAAITHQGRHENGHYICYRKMPRVEPAAQVNENSKQWWRLSDEQVWKVTEDDVLAQGGVFMLFYEQYAVVDEDLATSAASEELGEETTEQQLDEAQAVVKESAEEDVGSVHTSDQCGPASVITGDDT